MNKELLEEKLNQAKQLIEDCLSEISGGGASEAGTEVSKKFQDHKASGVDFSLNSRAFFRSYAKSLSGPKKFVLVVAYLTKGKVDSDATVADVLRCWNTHKKLLSGEYNGAYPTRAKEYGWINPGGKTGSFHLTNKWREIFS